MFSSSIALVLAPTISILIDLDSLHLGKNSASLAFVVFQYAVARCKQTSTRPLLLLGQNAKILCYIDHHIAFRRTAALESNVVSIR
ncbi:hypothetical protein F5B22DRAFT_298567 [Xylaria bambusicola]|uniref:uncharacterized protein n=1 Tax=Xylaria bambusicola TaxID=326684 RepID=UPI00200883E5|nr:uncharacterized protein F5B22DRAFT_298567 [Xylaria bambusicola]KAI0512616.1 hypothetical protein F5B22DRAFT_298567 [Xylaria bambusicola]